MVNSIEQFTAPGKYYYELSMELIEAELKKPSNMDYNKNNNVVIEDNYKLNTYYLSPHPKRK